MDNYECIVVVFEMSVSVYGSCRSSCTVMSQRRHDLTLCRVVGAQVYGRHKRKRDEICHDSRQKVILR